MEEPKEKHPRYLVDESRIEAQQDKTIGETPELQDHVGIINAALDCISTLLQVYEHSDEDELAALRLAVRCFNRHSPYAIQIRGIRTTFPPPRELYPLCSHPMA